MKLAKLKNYNPVNNTRKCKCCKRWLDLSLFSTRIHKRRKNLQVREICRKCSIVPIDNRSSNYRSPKYRKKLHHDNPRTMLLYSARTRAKTRGWKCNLSKEDIVIPRHCPLLGVKLAVGTGKTNRNSPSLDRLNPKKGYIKGNIWVISHRANSIKNDATYKELKLLTKNLGSCIKRMN